MNFKCPKCGSPYFGRDVAPDGTILPTVRCHGLGGDDGPPCDWRGYYGGVYNGMTEAEVRQARDTFPEG